MLPTKQAFLWGVATSAHQIEGYNEHSDWWKWELEGNIAGGAVSGAATDHWNRAEDDIRSAAELGIGSYRFSLEWAKLEPEEGHWNEASFQWYDRLIGYCEKYSLVPMVTLHHFTLPQWLAAKGGFTAPESISYYIRFVREVGKRFGDRIPIWCTFNEPMVLVTGSYLGAFMPPAKQEPKLVSLACENIFRAHTLAYELIHSEIKQRSGPWKDLPLQVGIAHNMLAFLPDRAWHPMEQILTRLANRFYNLAWLDAVTGRKQHFGVFGIVPYARQLKNMWGKCTVDFLGVNYYTKAYLRWRPREASTNTLASMPVGIAFARRNEEASDLGWALYPEGFGKILRKLATYRLPIYITENGIADKSDQLRLSYLRSHIEVMQKAKAEGADIRGYYHWSLMDNFEWIKGFGPRFGLFHVDYSNFKRTSRESALEYARIIRENSSP